KTLWEERDRTPGPFGGLDLGLQNEFVLLNRNPEFLPFVIKQGYILFLHEHLHGLPQFPGRDLSHWDDIGLGQCF
ncbi:MAG: hypothetical protein ACFFEW_18390, partial [Candidatus Thorarchaeota archaeon]